MTPTRWQTSGAGMEVHEPRDAEDGTREWIHADPDGNVLRFASPLDISGAH